MTERASGGEPGGQVRPGLGVGILGYGGYIPCYRLSSAEVGRMWRGGRGGALVQEKAVAGPDEDTATICMEAGHNALLRAGVERGRVGALWVGTESKPYAVKPTSTLVAQALGVGPWIQAADMEFACKAGSEAFGAALGAVGSGLVDVAMVFGADVAQGRPSDALEVTAAAGGACLVLGAASESVAVVEGSCSYVTNTPDFFRRQHERYPRHGHRFTGDAAYFTHILRASRALLKGLGRSPADYQHAVFHQPNEKFPLRVAKELGFTRSQLAAGLLSPRIGNTYAGAALLGLTSVLDEAREGDRIFVATFGSGAGSDAFSLEVTAQLEHKRTLAPSTASYIARRVPIDYATYARFREKLHR